MSEKNVLNSEQNEEVLANDNNQKTVTEDIWGDEEIVVEDRKAKKEKNKVKKEKKNKSEKKHVFKKFFYGVGKEFERVSWTSKKDLALNFLTILVVVTFFAVIFTLISIGITHI